MSAVPLGAGVNALTYPSLGRMAFGFLITIAVAIAVTYLFKNAKRLKYRELLQVGGVRLLAKTQLSRGLSIHVVEVDGVRMVIAEGRVGVAVCAVPESRPSTAESDT